MRRVPVTMNEADKKRILLALQYQALGLPDPLAAVRDAGFSIQSAGDGLSHFRIDFQGHRVAGYYGTKGFTKGNDLDVEDFVPESADVGLARIVHNLRDTAKTIDSLIKADKRHIETFKAACKHAGAESFTAWTPESLFLTTVASTRSGEPIQLRYQQDQAHAFEVRYVSQLMKVNTVKCAYALMYENGQINPTEHTPAEAVLRGLEARGRDLYAEVIRGISAKADKAAMTHEHHRHWIGVDKTVIETPEVNISIQPRSVRISKNGLPILRMISRFDSHAKTYALHCADGGLSAETHNGLISLATREIMNVNSFTAKPLVEHRVLPQIDIGRATAQALLEADFGYE